MDNRVPEHCQHLICLPVGKRGQRTASVSPLPISSSLKSVGVWAGGSLPQWVTLPLSPLRPLETIWGPDSLYSALARALPQRRYAFRRRLSPWQEMLEPDHYSSSLTGDYWGNWKKRKKIHPCHPTHRHLTDASSNTLERKKKHWYTTHKCRCRPINPLLKA